MNVGGYADDDDGVDDYDNDDDDDDDDGWLVAVGLARVRAGVKIRTPAYTLIYPPSWSPNDDEDGRDDYRDNREDNGGDDNDDDVGGGNGDYGTVADGDVGIDGGSDGGNANFSSMWSLDPETSQTSCSK